MSRSSWVAWRGANAFGYVLLKAHLEFELSSLIAFIAISYNLAHL